MPSLSGLNRSILRTLLVVGFSSVLPKAALVIRDLLIATHYGPSDMVDAFLAALSVPSILVQVVVQAFASALIPAFMHLQKEQGTGPARILSETSCFYGGLFLLFLTLVFWASTPWIIGILCPGFPPDKQALAASYLVWFVPLIALQGYVAIGSALLNAHGRFAMTSLLPSITPLLVMLSLLSPQAAHDIRPAIFATLGGAGGEMALILWLLHREKIGLWQRGSVSPLLSIARQAMPMIASMMFINANLLIDQGFASTLGSGSIAALVFGSKVPAFVLSIAAFPIGTAVLPHFSRHAALADWSGLWRSLRFWNSVCFLSALPLTLLLMWFSRDIVQILFERGKFSSADVESVTLIQICYLGQIPGYMLGYIGSRMITSIQMNGVLLKIAFFSLLVNTIGDFFFMKKFGLPGIAVTTAVTYSISAIAIIVSLFLILRNKHMA